MERIYAKEEEFLKDPAVKEFTKAVRKLSEEIPFVKLTIKHEIDYTYAQIKDHNNDVVVMNIPYKTNDCFNISVAQRLKKSYYVLSDMTLPEYPPIYLSQCEYDMLVTNDQKEGKTFGDFKTYLNMQAAGWFKDILHDMLIDDIIAECKIK